MNTIPTWMLVLGILAGPSRAVTQDTDSLAGIWEAQRHFGPEVRGSLVLTEVEAGWQAVIADRSVSMEELDGVLQFAVPEGLGRFEGRRVAEDRILGHWFQPPLMRLGREVASPVQLRRSDVGRWTGTVRPRDDRFTFFLVLREREDGALGAFLRNPERNLGVFLDLDHVEREGNRLGFVGRERGSPSLQPLLDGIYRPDEDRITITFPNRGGAYEFTRVTDDPDSAFFARGKTPAPWKYEAPPEQDDGWPTGRLDEVGIAVEPLRELIETRVDPPATDVHAPYPHALLIVRHGTLVLEEYFHGFHRGEPHDTRSASKSFTSVLTGAVIASGAPLDVEQRVYEQLARTYELPAGLDERKRDMTVEHLLTMSSGHFCDDDDPEAPGNEGVMQSQTAEPDWYRYTLGVPMIREPGARATYCSADSNLLGAVLGTVTGKPLEVLFQDLIAEPLQLGEYHLILQPSGEPYMGGGIHWLPRDFLKLGQLVLNGGFWNDRAVLDPEWAVRSTSRQVGLGGRGYGYLWWVDEYAYRDHSVQGFLAGGNGGQVLIGVPELDLLVLFLAGNYSDATLFVYQNEWMPDYILRAVEE